MKRKYFIIPVLCLAFFAFAAYGARKPRNAFPMVNSEEMGSGVDRNMDTKKMNKGNPAPDFEMMDLNGNTVKLSDFAGEKVYIKYWASWCPICLGGLEDINTLSAENNGFKVLTIVAPGSKGEKNDEDFKTWFAGVEHTENGIAGYRWRIYKQGRRPGIPYLRVYRFGRCSHKPGSGPR